MQEIPAPMTSLYLLRGSPFYESHDFANLRMTQVIKAVEGTGDTEASLVPVEIDTFAPLTAITDYVESPEEVISLSLQHKRNKQRADRGGKY